jgi:hypothetical protein
MESVKIKSIKLDQIHPSHAELANRYFTECLLNWGNTTPAPMTKQTFVFDMM